MKTEMIRARVRPDLKADAERVLNELGISATDAITIFYRQIVLRGGLPFDVLLPNAKTRKALKEAAAGTNLLTAKDADELCEELGLRREVLPPERNHDVKTGV